ncbi:MAG: hypothetical protein AAFY15_07850 [Cyanobacteria bacterium J06648_11]
MKPYLTSLQPNSILKDAIEPGNVVFEMPEHWKGDRLSIALEGAGAIVDVYATINRVRKTSTVLLRTTSVKAADGLRRFQDLATDSGGLIVSRARVVWGDLSASLGMLRK